MKKLLLKPAFVVVTLLAAMMFHGCVSYQTTPTKVVRYDYAYNNPAWAPSYYAGARYYYFPDIEVYYDLSSGNFIMLNTGRWLYVQSIAPFYSDFDLYGSYIVVLNTTVYQPWMHHHYYVKHYPRYYYIDYYDYSNIPYVRGYNENQKRAIQWSEADRYRARPWDGRNVGSNRQFSYSTDDKRIQQETTRQVNQQRATASSRTQAADRSSTTTRNTNDSRSTATNTNSTATRNTTTERNSITTANRSSTTSSSTSRSDATTTSRTTDARSNIQSSTPTRSSSEVRESTNTNYYGTTIGKPVRVESQMKRSETSTRQSTTTERNSSTSSGSTRSSTTRTGGGR